jgi:hypothetical protein
LPKLEKIVGGDIDFGLAWWERWEVDGIDVGVAAEHQLQFEPFYFLYAWLGIASGCESFGDIWAPTNDLLVLIVVEDCRDLCATESVSHKAEKLGIQQQIHAFCFVWVPAPGHSTMISSLASVFVAKAKATPENVVP